MWYCVDLLSFRAAFHHQLELSGCEAALSSLTQICSQLSSVRDQKRLALNQLQDKKRQIDQFTLIAVSDNFE